MAEENATAVVEKRGPGRPKGSGKRGRKPGKKRGPKPGKKRGPKPGKKRGPKPGRRARKSGRRGAGLIGKAVAQQVRAALKGEKAATKALVKSLVAKELKRAFKAL